MTKNRVAIATPHNYLKDYSMYEYIATTAREGRKMNNSSFELLVSHPRDKAIARALIENGFTDDYIRIEYIGDGELLDAIGEVEGWLIARLCYTGKLLCFPPKSQDAREIEKDCLAKDFAPGSNEDDWLSSSNCPWGLPQIGLDNLFEIKSLIESTARSWELSCGQQLALPEVPCSRLGNKSLQFIDNELEPAFDALEGAIVQSELWGKHVLSERELATFQREAKAALDKVSKLKQSLTQRSLQWSNSPPKTSAGNDGA